MYHYIKATTDSQWTSFINMTNANWIKRFVQNEFIDQTQTREQNCNKGGTKFAGSQILTVVEPKCGGIKRKRKEKQTWKK